MTQLELGDFAPAVLAGVARACARCHLVVPNVAWDTHERLCRRGVRP